MNTNQEELQDRDLKECYDYIENAKDIEGIDLASKFISEYIRKYGIDDYLLTAKSNKYRQLLVATFLD